MVVCTDAFGLNNCKMFEKIRAGLSQSENKAQNILDSSDDLLYAWDSTECFLLVLNWRAAKLKGSENIKYQTLVPSVLLNFQVDKILASPEGSLIALAGSRGLSVLELPKRWGANGQFLDGKEKITCKTRNLDENFFINNSHLELLQIRWHPGSPIDAHILALLSDNTLRMYGELTLRHVWRIGPLPSTKSIEAKTQINNNSSDGGRSSAVVLYSLGEIAVDFDIAPPRVVLSSGNNNNDDVKKDCKFPNNSLQNVHISNNNSLVEEDRFRNALTTPSSSQKQQRRASNERVEWPIVILRGNGNIYVLCAGIDTDKPKLQGPLTIQPPTTDNYGLDSCSILVIPSLPPALVIAESTGKLHHALFLEAETSEKSFNEIDASLVIYPSEWIVNVVETVELELGLPTTSSNTKSHICPIHLKRDFINELRYFAYHNTGLHVITMNFVKEIQRFVESNEPSSSITLGCLPHAEYIVCTKAEDKNKINAVMGFVILQMPSGICLLLASGQVISLNVIIDLNLFTDLSILNISNETNIPTSSSTITTSATISSIQKIMNKSFISHIHYILQRTVSQPILSIDKSSEIPPEEAYKLLQQAIQVLREQYFRKHEKAGTEILKRVKILKLLKQQQIKEVELLEQEKDSIQLDAERLADKYEEIYEKQQVLSSKFQDIVRQANIRIPNNSMADKEFTENVAKTNETVKKMKRSLAQAKEKMKQHQYHINKYTSQTENKKIVLPPKQEKLIKDILSEITTEIDYQIREIKRIHKIANLTL